MATEQLMAPIPSIALAPGMVVRFEAIDPTTGAAVAGVKVSAIALSGEPLPASSPLELTPGAFMLVPGPEG